jgi:hypothetical protein
MPAVRLLADRVGNRATVAGGGTTLVRPQANDRGRVLVDAATMITAGREAIADIDTLRHQDQVLGPVARASVRGG